MRAATTIPAIAIAALSLAVAAPRAGYAQYVPPPQSFTMPTPQPRPTISGTPLPYPAYGTPAPDVAAQTPKKGVPPIVNLAQAVKIAVALSPVFAADNAQWAAIHAKYTSEKQALYPALSGTATMGKQYTDSSIGLGGNVLPSASPQTVQIGTTDASENVQIVIQQLIYDGGRTIAAIHSAKSADFSGRSTLLRQLQTLEINVANAYYALLQDNATVVADHQLVHEFEVNEESVAAQIRNGAAARSDIATAQFQTAQAKGQLVTAQGALIAAQAAFATTLGLDANTDVTPKELGNMQEGTNPNYETSLQRALLMRPDYIAAAYTVESDKEGLRYAKLARFPVLTAAASDGTGRTFTNYALTTGYTNQKQVGLTLTVPIYDQGLTNYNVAVAAAALDQAFDGLRQSKLQVESDVRSAVANLISARQALVQARAELTAAQVSLDATQAQYKVGATTIVNVVTTEANLSTAQATYITALYAVQTAEQNYLYATGVSDIQL